MSTNEPAQRQNVKRRKVRTSPKPEPEKGCSRCSRDPSGGEAFRCYDNTFKFNVDIARQFVADGRAPVELDEDDIRYSIERAEINEQHVPHVDPTIPGIVTHVFFPTKRGELVHAHRLIDGHHRAARCLQLGISFKVLVLTEDESVAILERAPPGARRETLLSS